MERMKEKEGKYRGMDRDSKDILISSTQFNYTRAGIFQGETKTNNVFTKEVHKLIFWEYYDVYLLVDIQSLQMLMGK